MHPACHEMTHAVSCSACSYCDALNVKGTPYLVACLGTGRLVFGMITLREPSQTRIRPFRNGWQVYEAPGVQPVFLNQEQAIDYVVCRACFRSGEIRILDSSGKIERTIPFNEADRIL